MTQSQSKRSGSLLPFLRGFFLGSVGLSFMWLMFQTVSQSQYYLDSELQEEQSLLIPKKILLTKWLGSQDIYFHEHANKVCSNRCIFTTNMSEFNQSSLVVFHGNNHKYLSDQKLVRSSPKQIWVWLNLEAPISYVYLPEHHKRLRFNWTWSYRLDSDIFAPYRQIFLRDKVPDRMQIIQNYSMVNLRGREVPTELPSLDGFKDRKPAAWIVSHCRTWSRRELLVSEINKHFPVDIYGACGIHKCNETYSSSLVKNSEECRFQIHKKYKFYLAFENALCTDYVTEKFFETLYFDMIPVVYGSAEYSKLFPKKSFINAQDFPNLTSLVEHLKYVGDNPQVWLQYFEWRKSYRIIDSHYLPAYCDICDKLIRETESPSVQVQSKYYTDLSKWWIYKQNSTNKTSASSRNCKSTLEATEMLAKFIKPKS